MAVEWLWRLVNRIRPREGWATFLTIWGALFSLAWSVQVARWVDEARFRLFFVNVTLIGGLLGWLLARSRLRGWLAGALGGLAGMGFVVNTVGRVLPPGAQWMTELGYLGRWLQRGLTAGDWMQLPFRDLLSESGQRLAFLAQRLAVWATAVRAGETSQDQAAFLLLVGLALWAAALWAMWGLYRRWQPLAALLPGGIIAALSVHLSDKGLSYLLAFLACGVFLMPWVRLGVLFESWERRGVDYSPEVRLEVGLWGFIMAMLVVIASVALPSFTVRQAGRWVGERWPAAWRLSGEDIQGVFGLRRPAVEGGGGAAGGAAGELPRAHLLGGAADLTRQPVMAVITDDPPLSVLDGVAYRAPQYYWRGGTYARYTGRGWVNDALETARYGAGEALPAVNAQTRRELRQQFIFFDTPHETVYAAGDPLWLDVPYRARWRAPDDLAGLEAGVRRYTVVSAVSQAGEAALRQATADYAPEFAGRYLQLPDDLPPRVVSLARRVVADVPTPYDKALALQAYLRQFPYSLQVEPAPPERDVVDYFLFDLQTGYCDYYASALAVMARAVGLPARLAVGYAAGAFDFERGYYYVVEADAHSWPQVYFPGYGWLDFEPTAALSPFERPAGDGLPAAPPPLPPPPRDFSAAWWAGRLRSGAGLLLLGLLGWLVWSRWLRLAWLPGPALMARLEDGLARHGARLGAPRRASDTPGEYRRLLARAVGRRAARPRWPGGRLAGHVRRVENDLAALERLYLKAIFSRYPLSEGERRAALSVWRGLSWRLWLLWLAGKLEGGAKGWTMGQFEVLVQEGAPHGGLYELEQTTYYHVVDRRSKKVVLTFQGEMEASLSTTTGMWDDYHFSGVCEVRIAPGEQSVVVRYHDGREETAPLPQ